MGPVSVKVPRKCQKCGLFMCLMTTYLTNGMTAAVVMSSRNYQWCSSTHTPPFKGGQYSWRFQENPGKVGAIRSRTNIKTNQGRVS